MGLWMKAEQERAQQLLYHHVGSLQPGPCVPPTPPGTCGLGGGRQDACPSPVRDKQNLQPDGALVYDEVLQQHRRLLSKLDLEEKRRRDAREGGYYYDLNDSYDESDEEEVKAHLRRVTEQPPLKLHASSEKVDFLRLCGLSTLAHRDELLARKRRKRRSMMLERSPSPHAVQGKRKAPPPAAPLSTPFTAEQMNSCPRLQDKKDFLLMFKLNHVSPQQRRDKERTEELLKAIHRKSVTLDTLRYSSQPGCSSPPAADGDSSAAPLPCRSNGHLLPDSPSPSPPYLHKAKHPNHDAPRQTPDSQVARVPPPLSSQHHKAEYLETHLSKRVHKSGVGASPQSKDGVPPQNGRCRPWERVTPETFAQHFHQAVLQSTHSSQPSRGVSLGVREASVKAEGSPAHCIPPLKALSRTHGTTQVNGHRLYPAPPGRERLSDDEDEDNSGREEENEEEDEEEEEDDEEEPPRKWQGIESIFDAYQEYVEEWSIERQVLHTQCKRLEAQNYTLTRTAEQLSLTMGELVGQRQKVREEREKLQAQLEHFRRCLTLPSIHWGRGPLSWHAPR